jgi:hypothetical protein
MEVRWSQERKEARTLTPRPRNRCWLSSAYADHCMFGGKSVSPCGNRIAWLSRRLPRRLTWVRRVVLLVNFVTTLADLNIQAVPTSCHCFQSRLRLTCILTWISGRFIVCVAFRWPLHQLACLTPYQNDERSACLPSYALAHFTGLGLTPFWAGSNATDYTRNQVSTHVSAQYGRCVAERCLKREDAL